MAIALVVSGACGRMGRSIAELALKDKTFTLSAVLEAQGHESVGQDYGTVLNLPKRLNIPVGNDANAALSRGDVLIEFTSPEVTIAHAQLAQGARKPMIIGTTGLSESQLSTLRTVAKSIPIVFSPNMSVGVNVLFELVQLAATRLGMSYDVEVIEGHHRHKKDSPSGTAKRLLEVLGGARKQSSVTIPVHAIRAGEIVGDHTVLFAGPSERLELTHRAQGREVFAAGALKAAAWVKTQPPGLYDMTDVLKAASAA